MTNPIDDPLLLGQRVVAILETGLRTATYKLATLMGVLEIYWRQVRPFEGQELRQSTQPRARILIATSTFRSLARGIASLDVAIVRAPSAYKAAIDEIVLCLAQQPLHRLQRLPGADSSDAFLYDDSFLHDQISRNGLRDNGDAIDLKPGVAFGLARLAGLLKPALEIMWVEDVRRINKFLAADVPDVAGHLFGRERVAMAAIREPFKDAFGAHCFYCGTHLNPDNPIDHVLPWSVVGIDGLTNLVLACTRCNSDKRNSLLAHSARSRRGGRPRRVPRSARGSAHLVRIPPERRP